MEGVTLFFFEMTQITEDSLIVCELHCEKDRANCITVFFVPKLREWTCEFVTLTPYDEESDEVQIDVKTVKWMSGKEVFEKVKELVQTKWKRFRNKKVGFHYFSRHAKLKVTNRSKDIFHSLYLWIQKVERFSFCFSCCKILDRDQHRNLYSCSNECLEILDQDEWVNMDPRDDSSVLSDEDSL